MYICMYYMNLHDYNLHKKEVVAIESVKVKLILKLQLNRG